MFGSVDAVMYRHTIIYTERPEVADTKIILFPTPDPIKLSLYQFSGTFSLTTRTRDVQTHTNTHILASRPKVWISFFTLNTIVLKSKEQCVPEIITQTFGGTEQNFRPTI
jgi:hypothetical protein